MAHGGHPRKPKITRSLHHGVHAFKLGRISIFASLTLALVATASWRAAESTEITEALSKGERTVFLSDSITQAGAAPGSHILPIQRALSERPPDTGIEVIVAGISHNKVPDLETRVERDFLAKKPTRLVIYIGINDV
jgi:hypothetical protein